MCSNSLPFELQTLGSLLFQAAREFSLVDPLVVSSVLGAPLPDQRTSTPDSERRSSDDSADRIEMLGSVPLDNSESLA